MSILRKIAGEREYAIVIDGKRKGTVSASLDDEAMRAAAIKYDIRPAWRHEISMDRGKPTIYFEVVQL